jgi:ureidoacrylate peracid hydrolase
MKSSLEFTKSDSALIIIDMQNAFLNKNGSLSKMGLDTSRTNKVIEPIKVLKEIFSKNKRPIIYLQHTHRNDGNDVGLIDKVFPPIMKLGHCIENTWDFEVIDELKPNKNDIIVRKYRFSGFFNTDLDTVLGNLGIKTLVVCGIATNICVESTIRDAFYRDYNVFVPEESTASFFVNAELAALENFKFAFARVIKMDDMIKSMDCTA